MRSHLWCSCWPGWICLIFGYINTCFCQPHLQPTSHWTSCQRTMRLAETDKQLLTFRCQLPEWFCDCQVLPQAGYHIQYWFRIIWYQLHHQWPLTYLPCFVRSPMWNSTMSPLSHIELTFNLWSSECLLAVVRAINMTNLRERSFSGRSSLFGCRLMRSRTTSTSHVSVYLGCGERKLNIPFNSLVRITCWPIDWPWISSW